MGRNNPVSSTRAAGGGEEEEEEEVDAVASPPRTGAGSSGDHKEQQRRLRDRMKPDERAMTWGMVNVIVTAFTIGRWPQHFWLVHLLKISILLPWRYLRFRRQGWQFYMVEFCYFVSYCTLLACVLAVMRVQFGYVSPLAPYNSLLIRIGFAFASGAPQPPPVMLARRFCTLFKSWLHFKV
jgi:hypothetical protein